MDLGFAAPTGYSSLENIVDQLNHHGDFEVEVNDLSRSPLPNDALIAIKIKAETGPISKVSGRFLASHIFKPTCTNAAMKKLQSVYWNRKTSRAIYFSIFTRQ
jgi:hypothetical protein